MQKKINKIGIALSIVLVFLGMMGFGQTTLDPSKKSIQAWIFPGDPACNANKEISTVNNPWLNGYVDGRIINCIKPQYYTLYSNKNNSLDPQNGSVIKINATTNNYDPVYCNGWCPTNVNKVLDYTPNTLDKNRDGFFTISGSGNGLKALLGSPTLQNHCIGLMLLFFTDNYNKKFLGVEIDFEHPTDGWQSNAINGISCWENYKTFINNLGTQLHNHNKQLYVVGKTQTSETTGGFSYSFFKNNPNVDYICMMAYDRMHDFSSQADCGAVAPYNWTNDLITHIKSKMLDNPNYTDIATLSTADLNRLNKIVIAMPSYGYHWDPNNPRGPIVNNTKDEVATYNGFNSTTNPPVRDPLSGELKFTSSQFTKPVYYLDAVSMSDKVEFIRSKGIKHVSVWHIGGNDWFNKFNTSSYNTPTETANSDWTNAMQALNNDLNYAIATTTNKELILSNFNFNVSQGQAISGVEIVVIGHTTQTGIGKSRLSVQLSDNAGASYTAPKFFDIYSHHDVIKIIGSATDYWGKSWNINSHINANFRVKIIYEGLENPYIDAVYAKVYSSDPTPYVISAADDDAASAYIPGSAPIYNNGLPDYTHHRFGLYKKNSTTDGKYFENGFRFQSINIPEGSTINSAYLDLYHRNQHTNITSNLDVKFYVVNNTNTSAFSDTQGNRPSDKPLLPNVISSYTFLPITWSGAADGYSNNRLINVTNLVQAITSSANGWVENNSITIIGKPDNPPISPILSSNCIGYSTYEGNVGKARLIVNFTSPPPCNYDPIAEHINNTSNVWSNSSANPKLVYYDIIVEAGGTLTITGTVKFTEQAKIIVMPGGKLIVDGGTLTNLCNNKLWQGIIVQGDKYKSQFQTQYHGIVELKNNATIANAVIGIQTQNYIANSNFGGGIIKAYNASFYNNKTAVKMRKYANYSTNNPMFPDISTFKNCNFIIDNNYLSLNPFEQFINLDYISGIEIMGCRFKNLATNIAPDFSNAGIGIKSDFSSYNIDNFANQTEFQNLQYGIKNTSSLSTNPIKVKNVLFNNNLHGFYANNLDKAWLTANTFKIPDNFTQTNAEVAESDNTAYGMYLDYCTRYILEGNNFNTVDNAVNNATYGLIINGSGDLAAANSVYNNSFQNIERSATQSQGDNSGYGNVQKGLKIKCNDYSGNKQDISVIGQGISVFQGTSTTYDLLEDRKKPAGNTFSKFGPVVLIDFTDINNGGANINYYHHAGNNAYSWVPKYCNPEPKVSPFAGAATYTNKEETCPGIALQTGTPQPYPYQASQVSSIIQGKTAQLNTSKLIYSLWVDNGNTEGLRHDIKISTSWDAFDLYNELLLGSPKLSEEVLIDAIKREDVLTPLMLKLVLLANPQVCRYEKAWDALINRTNPLPDAWIDEIKQGLAVISPIENMQADISYYASERNTYMNLLKQCYLNDTTETGMQQYLSLLNNESDIESKYELVFAKISNQDYEGALSTLSSIETMIDREKYPEEADRHANMTNLIPLLITIETSHPRWNDLSENDRNLLINLSETDNTITGSLATASRMALEPGFVYKEPIYLPTDRPLKMSLPKKGKTTVTNEQHIKISPNPATDYIAIECNIEGFGTNLRLQITDAMGKTVLEKELGKAQQIIDIREFAKGSYYCTVYNNGKALDTVKFIKK